MGLKVDGVTSKLKFKVGYHVNAMETPNRFLLPYNLESYHFYRIY